VYVRHSWFDSQFISQHFLSFIGYMALNGKEGSSCGAFKNWHGRTEENHEEHHSK
jgi:hypothetical protein